MAVAVGLGIAVVSNAASSLTVNSSSAQPPGATATTESVAEPESVEDQVRPMAGGHRSTTPKDASVLTATRPGVNVAVQSTASPPASSVSLPMAQRPGLSTPSTAVEPLVTSGYTATTRVQTPVTIGEQPVENVATTAATDVVNRVVAAVSSFVGFKNVLVTRTGNRVLPAESE